MVILESNVSKKNQKELNKWKALKRSDVNHSSDVDLQLIIGAVGTGEMLDITYNGGSTPGLNRKITPIRVYRVHGIDKIYIEAFCTSRNDKRTFNYELLELHNINQNIQYDNYSTSFKNNNSSSPWSPKELLNTSIIIPLFLALIIGFLMYLSN